MCKNLNLNFDKTDFSNDVIFIKIKNMISRLLIYKYIY